jgi:zinc transport system ATP-binding protein
MLVSLNSVGYILEKEETPKTLLHDINLDVLPNSVTTIIGPNGAGKTTLVRLLLGLIEPTSGTITRQKNITMGYVPQKLHANRFMPMTVSTFLSLCGIQKIDYPFDIVNLMTRSIHALSGGELQKVLFNAAVLKKPDLLILDEPTQGIDADGQSAFYRKLIELKNEYQIAIVLISHDLHFVFDCTDHVICLNHHVCCQGTPEKVRQVQEVQQLFPGFVPYHHTHDHQHL